MAKKTEVVTQKKDEHENRNAVIVGFLLIVLGCVIFFLLLWFGGAFKPPEPPPPLQGFDYAVGLDERKVIIRGILPTFALAYLILGAGLYIISLKFGKRFNLRFWAKSIFFGGIIGIVMAIFTNSMLFY